MSAQLGKYLIVILHGRVEHGSIPPGNAPYIFAIPPAVQSSIFHFTTVVPTARSSVTACLIRSAIAVSASAR